MIIISISKTQKGKKYCHTRLLLALGSSGHYHIIEQSFLTSQTVCSYPMEFYLILLKKRKEKLID